jgi:hypothetical protein
MSSQGFILFGSALFLTVYVSPVGAQGNVALSSSSLDFGDVETGQAVTKTVTATNTGPTPQFITAQLGGSGSVNFRESNNCSLVDEMASRKYVSPGQSCTITISFIPVISGFAQPEVNVSASPSTGPTTVLSIALSGTGVGGNTLAASPPSRDFGYQELFATWDSQVNYPPPSNPGHYDNPGFVTYIFTIGNPTTGPIPIPKFTTNPAPDFLISNDCPAVLDVNATCKLYSIFMPQGLGERQGTIYVGQPPSGVGIGMTGRSDSGTLYIGNEVYYRDYFFIENVLSGKVLDVTNASVANGARIQQWDFNHYQQQLWHLVPSGPSYVVMNALSGAALDVTNASTVNGTPIQQWAPNGGGQQLWNFVAAGPTTGGFSNVVNVLTSKVLDVTNASTSDGALVQQWTSDNFEQQWWQVVPSSGVSISSRLSSSIVGLTLTVAGASTANGARIQQAKYNLAVPPQTWLLIPVGQGYFKIQNTSSEKVLDVTDASLSDGAAIQQWDYNGAWQQQWWLEPTGVDDFELFLETTNFYIVNRLSGKVLDVTNASLADGAPIQQWSSNGGWQQQWRFYSPR